MAVPVVIVAGIADNGVIGDDNRLIWRLKTDLRHFRALTLGRPVIMGRKTFLSIGKPLPGRETIVLTRDQGFVHPGIYVAHDLDSALQLARERAGAMGAKEIIVAGGGDLYAQTIGLAQRLDVTEVNLSPSGDAFFPAFDQNDWIETARTPHEAGPGDEAAFTVLTFERA